MWDSDFVINVQRGMDENQESMPRKQAIQMWWKRMRACDRSTFQHSTIRERIKHLICEEKFCRDFNNPRVILVINNRIFAAFPHSEAGKPHHHINFSKTKFFMWKRRKGD